LPPGYSRASSSSRASRGARCRACLGSKPAFSICSDWHCHPRQGRPVLLGRLLLRQGWSRSRGLAASLTRRHVAPRCDDPNGFSRPTERPSLHYVVMRDPCPMCATPLRSGLCGSCHGSGKAGLFLFNRDCKHCGRTGKAIGCPSSFTHPGLGPQDRFSARRGDAFRLRAAVNEG